MEAEAAPCVAKAWRLDSQALSSASTCDMSAVPKQKEQRSEKLDRFMFYSSSTCDTLGDLKGDASDDVIEDEGCEGEEEEELSNDSDSSCSDLSEVVHINGQPVREECPGFDQGQLGDGSSACVVAGDDCGAGDSKEDADSYSDDDCDCSMSVVSSVVHINGVPVLEGLDGDEFLSLQVGGSAQV